MTEAFQTGQFHTGSSDRPATEPSVFNAMADTPAAGVQAEESVTQSLADAAKGGPEVDPEAEGDEKSKKSKEAENPVLEKARKTDAERVERFREEQQATEPPDEKAAKAITKANEDIQLAAHAAHLDALEVAEKENARVEKAQEAAAKKAEKGEAPAAAKAEAEPETKKAETVEAAKATEKAAAKTTAAAKKAEAEDEEEYEEVDVEDLTIPELKAELDAAEVEYPSDARKPELIKLLKKTWK